MVSNLSYDFYVKGSAFKEEDCRKKGLTINVQADYPMAELAPQKFDLRVTYPGLAVGLGLLYLDKSEEGIKNGISLDYNSGLPIIQGSSIKGRLKSICESLAKSESEFAETGIEKMFNNKKKYLSLPDDTEIQFDSLRLRISNAAGQYFKGSLSDFIQAIFGDVNSTSDDIFYDAIANSGATIREDFVTPHKDIFKDPVPIRFLRLTPPTSFKFLFDLSRLEISNDDGDEKFIMDPEQKKEFFKELLKDYGIGAKINKGYGYLE